jgi:hypothetical protein
MARATWPAELFTLAPDAFRAYAERPSDDECLLAAPLCGGVQAHAIFLRRSIKTIVVTIRGSVVADDCERWAIISDARPPSLHTPSPPPFLDRAY